MCTPYVIIRFKNTIWTEIDTEDPAKQARISMKSSKRSVAGGGTTAAETSGAEESDSKNE
jgi:hypothetical protein